MTGTIGLRAGSQPDSGVYLLERLFSYSSNKLIDGSGHRLPLSLDLNARANVLGIGATFKVPWISGYMNVSAGVPIARLSLQTDRLEAGIDRFGLGDVYLFSLKHRFV